MNRSEYLRDSSVEAFIDWLRPHIRGDCRFQHKFTLLKPHRDWSCNSIWEAYENYWWPIPGRNTGSFEANQGELDRLAAAVRRARDGDNPDGFIEAACGILRWGGVTRSNGKTLRDLGGAALSTFRAASLLLDPSHADPSRLDGVRHMNAGWTKVYAVMLDGLPIYDGRVGAAMGYLVQRYCVSARLCQVPTRLRFRAPTPRGATVVIPPTRTATVSGRRPRSPARDRTIRQVQQAGRRQWKKDSGYHQQARMENAFFRYKLIIGESLRARSRAGQETEAILACNILNQMTQLGRLASYAIGR